MGDLEKAALTAFISEAVKITAKHASEAFLRLNKEIRSHDVFGTYGRKYRESLTDRYGTIKIFSMSKPIFLNSVYVKVNVLEHITANRYADVADLNEILESSWHAEIRGIGQRKFGRAEQTASGLDIVNDSQRLIVLGKPGSGKTTFLRHLIFAALENKFRTSRLPIYISLHRVSTFKTSILEAIENEFFACGISSDTGFGRQLLEAGEVILLFDGLDEVATSERHRVVQQLNFLSDRYPATKIIISCRVAAFNSMFPRFTEVEIADFGTEEQDLFIRGWFAEDQFKIDRCLKTLSEKPQLRELAATPLLLTIICVAFDENLNLSANRAELYGTAIDALLKKWDVSRLIEREYLYRQLTLSRKEDLLSFVAATSFWNEVFFFRESELADLIFSYMRNLTETGPSTAIDDAYGVQRAIAAQHGLFVDRARGVISFSHMTFQEYFTARYVARSGQAGFSEILSRHLGNPRWKEVFVLTAALLADADDFLICYLEAMGQIGFVTRGIVDIRLIKARQKSALSIPTLKSPHRSRADEHDKKTISPHGKTLAPQVPLAALTQRILKRKAQFSELLAADLKRAVGIFFRQRWTHSSLLFEINQARTGCVSVMARLPREIKHLETQLNDISSDKDAPNKIATADLITLKRKLEYLRHQLRDARCRLAFLSQQSDVINEKFTNWFRRLEEQQIEFAASGKIDLIVDFIQPCRQDLGDLIFFDIFPSIQGLRSELEDALLSAAKKISDIEISRISSSEALVEMLTQPLHASSSVVSAAVSAIAMEFSE